MVVGIIYDMAPFSYHRCQELRQSSEVPESPFFRISSGFHESHDMRGGVGEGEDAAGGKASVM